MNDDLDSDWDDESDEEFNAIPRPPKPRVLSSVIIALLATSTIVALLLMHVWSRYQVMDLGYRLSTLSSDREDLIEEQRRLSIELQVLTRPERIEPLARRQLGLAPPRPEQLLYVPAHKLPLPELNVAPFSGDPASKSQLSSRSVGVPR